MRKIINNNRYYNILKNTALLLLQKLSHLKFLVLNNAQAYPGNQQLVPEKIFEFNQIYNEKICIFAHFDSQNLIDDYVIFYLKQIYKNNFSIIFVSSSEKLNPTVIGKLNKICSVVILRKNIGYDFGSWKVGIDYINSKNLKPQTILIANDSVYGPINDCTKLFSKITNFESCDVWGVTDSFQVDYHLQSYFLSFHRTVIESLVWKKFWDDFEILNNKQLIIRKYEIGLSQLLIKNGFKLKSCYDAEKVIEYAIGSEHAYTKLLTKHGKNVNVTHILWDALVKKQYPFIKIELIRDNPVNVKTLIDFDSFLSKHSNYDKKLIINHLDRLQNENKSF